MAQPIPLHHVNGGEGYAPTCAYCGASLWNETERAAAHSISGTKFFCKADPEYPTESCYLMWKRNQN